MNAASDTRWPVRAWLWQYAIALPLWSIVLLAKELARGEDLAPAVASSISWALVTLALFAAVRAWHFYRGRYCALCGDAPASGPAD